jgi:hypothetical protein
MADVKIAATRVAAKVAGGSQDITIPGFGTPKAAVVILSRATADATPVSDYSIGVGLTDGTRSRCISAVTEDGVTTTDTDRSASSELVGMLFPVLQSMDARADFSSWITNGIRIAWTGTPNAGYLMTVILLGGADLTAYVNSTSFTVPDADGEDVTDPGFQPDQVWTICAGHNTDFTASPTITAECHWTFGVADDNGGGIDQWCTGTWLRDNFGSTSEKGCFYNAVAANTDATWTYRTVELTSMIASGFHLAQSSSGVNGTTYKIGYLALDFGGNSHSAGTAQSPTSTGDQGITAPGFTPGFGLFLAGMIEGTVPKVWGSTVGDTIGIGVADDAITEYGYGLADESTADPTNAESEAVSDAILVNDGDGTGLLQAALTSWDANGFTLNWSAVDTGTARNYGYAVIEATAGGASKVPVFMYDYRRRRA